jgi:hypothetical protein
MSRYAAKLPNGSPMKSIRPTRSQTRKGVLSWLAKLNPFFTTAQQQEVYNTPEIIAVHVDRYTGAIVQWELSNGNLLSNFPHLYTKAA